MSQENPDVPDREEKASSSDEPPKPTTDATPLAEKIGFAKLDLTVDEVEERISPRETNVFDK